VEAGNSFHQILRHGGHALFLEKEFDPEQHLRKAAIRRKFSRAAATYDEHATVQKEAAEQLAERLPDPGPASILELGCGTGNYTRLLADRYPTARLDALDFSESMLAMAREKMRGARVAFHCRDGELFLREGRERFDLITSNATLQWFDDLGRTAELLAGRLNPGGLFLATIFGPEGLRELREGLAAVNPAPVSLPIDAFPDRQELEKAFAGHLTGVEIEEWRLLRRYPTLADLLRHIRRTGTGGPRQNTALLDRPRFAALERWFAEAYGEWCISYQVFLVKATKEP
jgi:malonyl-CoA O-methyltransferase